MGKEWINTGLVGAKRQGIPSSPGSIDGGAAATRARASSASTARVLLFRAAGFLSVAIARKAKRGLQCGNNAVYVE